MDPLGLFVMGIIIILWAVAAVVPSMQRKRAEQAGQRPSSADE
jgi:hypothetical protein